MTSEKFLARFRVDKPEKFRLASCDSAHTGGLDVERDEGKEMLAQDIARLAEQQRRLHADGRWALLIVLQGMDASGKDGVIAHVMSGVNPQGVTVHPFTLPSSEEVAHDFLWRAAKRLPERGCIGIFNRSHYEEVLVVRVHEKLIERQRLPQALVGKHMWKERFQDIRAFERHLARSGIVVLKFFLNISRAEQGRRLLARLEEPDKRWKFSMSDVEDRKLWDEYMAVYEDMIRATSRGAAPWYVVPADHKWFARLVVARAMTESLQALDLEYPKIEGAALKELEKVRAALDAELAPRARAGARSKRRPKS